MQIGICHERVGGVSFERGCQKVFFNIYSKCFGIMAINCVRISLSGNHLSFGSNWRYA